MGQFLTAVFELRPTNRKAAALERVRAATEEAFWQFIDETSEAAVNATSISNKKDRRAATRQICSGAFKVARQYKLTEPVAQGMVRDIDQSVSSFIELTVKGQEASWPQRRTTQDSDMPSALAALAASADKESEDAARDALAKARKVPGLRPIIFARSRDARIVRDHHGRYAAVLNCLWASDRKSRQASVNEGIDPTTGEVIKASKSKARLIVPLSCSRWHENKFLNGTAILRSSLVFRRENRWFIASQFEMPERTVSQSGAVMGIDRGVVFPVSAGVVGADGELLDLFHPQGAEIGETIRASDERRRHQQQRRGFATFRHQEVVRHSLHRIANDIVSTALKYGAQVVVEKLGEMKQVITTRRVKGSRKGGWRTILKRVQLGELEQILEYKLALAGLPKIREIVAAGTSQTCPACGHRARENRVERDIFRCVSCGHEAHADQNASIIIARRGMLMRTLKKGDKLDTLHENMVASLRTRHDGGLGRRELFMPVVPAHASGVKANADSAPSPTLASEQKVTRVDQNAPTGVFAERVDAFFPNGDHRKYEPDQGPP